MEVLEKAYVNSPYGNRNGSFHTGVDVLSGCNNRKVYSPAKGKVIYVVNNFPDSEVFTEPHSGNEIRIEHGNGYITRYSHLKYNTITVNVGDIVEEGTVIAEEGMSGYATGVHLDFELWKDGNYKYVDPTDVALGKVRLPDYIVELFGKLYYENKKKCGNLIIGDNNDICINDINRNSYRFSSRIYYKQIDRL